MQPKRSSKSMISPYQTGQNLVQSKCLLYNYKDVSMAPYGELWRQMKSIYVVQLLSNKRVQSFGNLREEETALMVQKIRELGSALRSVNLTNMFMDLTNGVKWFFGRSHYNK
ncbi:hypothetical protein RHMOL_Rhmol08G0247600 [Rhododendron molle]|uniref:Uncharacterized protein n=1 Tax=Rhododendron molle TaxID=49168 RepID=A0ACC0MTK8_RHOML|nr:hypothetical protein RHMOL_Rhmol08G0247600 [Rhododendron molle]